MEDTIISSYLSGITTGIALRSFELSLNFVHFRFPLGNFLVDPLLFLFKSRGIVLELKFPKNKQHSNVKLTELVEYFEN